MAFELVTGHAAEAHITAEQVSRFIQGITVIDDTTVYRLNQGNDAALSVDTLTLTIATGETILHGFHSTNEDSLDITLDATTNASYSRIDKIVMEVLQDDTTGYQYTSILTVQGEEAESPTAPDTPSSSGSDTITLLAVGLIATVTVTDSVISAWTDNTVLYAGSYVTETEMDIVRAEVPWYATSSTAASTTAKVATCNQEGFSLVTGAKVIVKFDYTNTASAPTLNVDSTGALDIVAYGTTAPALFWVAGDVVEFTYNGTSWVMHPTQGQVEALNTNLNESKTVTATTYNSTYISNSYVSTIEFGNMVIISGRFTVGTEKPAGQSYWLFRVPVPIGVVVPVYGSGELLVNESGYLTSNRAVPATTYNIFVAYAKRTS